MSKVFSSIVTVALAIACAVVYYFALPAWTLRSPGLWGWLLMVVGCTAISISLFCEDRYSKPIIAAWITTGAVLLAFIVCWVSSWMMFHADEAYQVADVTKSENSFIEDFGDLSEADNMKNLPLVDLDTARTLGDKRLALLNNMSWYDVDDEYNLIKIPDGYYRLSVIDYGDLFKYGKASQVGLPGYVLVSVTPENGAVTQEATVVELEEKIQYSPGAFWSHDLRRHLRGQYPSYMFEDSSYLEIDDELQPYWVTGVLRPTAGVWGVMTVTSFILTDAQTGESVEYAVSDAPAWIDHVFSLRYLMEIAYWHYAYADGYWNDVFSKTDVLRTSYAYRDQHKADNENKVAGEFANFFGYSSIIGKDGEIMFYTGLTPANKIESNLGWLTMDISTGKMVQYDVVGAEESAAQAAVEQLVQAQGYEATFPLPANVAGEPSYIMCLKGKAGFVQSYGICSMENYSIVVQAETLDQAIRLYKQKLGNEATVFEAAPSVATVSEQETMTATAVIEAIYTAEIDGTTHFYYLIDGQLYRAPITINELQLLLKKGDEIAIGYIATEDVQVITSIAGSE